MDNHANSAKDSPLVVQPSESGTSSTLSRAFPRHLPKRSFCFFDVAIGKQHCGRLIFMLYDDVVPKTTANFLHLCRGDKGLGYQTGKWLSYYGSTFHRNIPKFMIQGGDFVAHNGREGESIYGGRFPDENFQLRHSKRGILSMANTGPDTNGSQYFILYAKAPHLDGRHVVFGEVIMGIEILDKLEAVATDKYDVPLTPLRITECGEILVHPSPQFATSNVSHKIDRIDDELIIPIAVKEENKSRTCRSEDSWSSLEFYSGSTGSPSHSSYSNSCSDNDSSRGDNDSNRSDTHSSRSYNDSSRSDHDSSRSRHRHLSASRRSRYRTHPKRRRVSSGYSSRCNLISSDYSNSSSDSPDDRKQLIHSRSIRSRHSSTEHGSSHPASKYHDSSHVRSKHRGSRHNDSSHVRSKHRGSKHDDSSHDRSKHRGSRHDDSSHGRSKHHGSGRDDSTHGRSRHGGSKHHGSSHGRSRHGGSKHDDSSHGRSRHGGSKHDDSSHGHSKHRGSKHNGSSHGRSRDDRSSRRDRSPKQRDASRFRRSSL